MATRAESVERYHRRRRRDKTLDPKPRACTNPQCTTGWERREAGYYCTPCHNRILELGDYHRRATAMDGEGPHHTIGTRPHFDADTTR